MNNDLIERLKEDAIYFASGTDRECYVHIDDLNAAITALSPVLPEDVQQAVDGLNHIGGINARIARDLIERLARQKDEADDAVLSEQKRLGQQVNEAVQREHILQQRIDELERSERKCKLAVVIAKERIEELERENASQKLALKVGPESYEKQIAEYEKALDEGIAFAARIAGFMEQGAGEPEPGNRLRQVEEGLKEIAERIRGVK